MQHWFTGTAVGGALLTLLTVFQVVYGALKWSSEEELKTLPKWLLAQDWLRLLLVILLVLSIGLNLFTSSLYIEFAGAESGVQKCTVEVIDASSGTRFVEPPITVTSVYKIVGERFFFRFRPTTLKFNLTEPAGRGQKTEKFGWESAIFLRAPADFPEKQFYLLRLVFGPRLWRILPEYEDAVSISYDLEISIGAERVRIPDVRRQTIVIGAGKEDLDYVLKQEDPNKRKNAFVEHLSVLAVPPEQQPGFISEWEGKLRPVATAERSPDEPIDIALRRRGDETPVVREQVTKTISSPIQTVLVEIR